ncbi:GNAT family N-acetyltransferase [Roseateles sp. NT4]|uniref:GNAT family N-acetyltransferase n=1 Tax=Roseateles sp. NT4 TaxID=3453715 RepID=UPI003EED53B2
MPLAEIDLLPPQPDQMPRVRAYLEQLARDEGVPQVKATDDFLTRTLTGPQPAAVAHLVHRRGVQTPCGLTVHSWKWGPFSGVLDMYLHVLVLDPASRGQGLGRAVVQRLLDIAADKGASRLELLTTRDNVGAATFYDSLGLTLASHMMVRRRPIAAAP